MKKKRILALFLAAVSCLSLAVSASAANTVNCKATDFRDYDRTAWYAEAVSAAVDNGLLYGKSANVLDPNGDMTRAEMAAIINRSFGCYVKADISKYKDVSKDKWYFEDVAMAVQMGTYNGRSNTAMAPDAPITRQEAMTVVARALELDYDSYSKTELAQFSDTGKISAWALPYVRAMVGADYIHGRGKVLAPLDNITRAEFAQIFHNIILIRVYNSLPDESIDRESDVTVHCDGRTYTVVAGTQVRLTPGESIHIQQYMYHDFEVESGTGPVLLGEVSQCNDDNTDNRFNPPVGRFPKIEEDEAPYRLLCNEYPKI